MKLSYCFLILGALLFYPNCTVKGQNYIPAKHEDMSNGTYNKYLNLLKSAYHKNDKIEAAVQLANLNAEKKLIFEMLNEGIIENPDQCVKIYNWYWQYDRYDFKINLVKLDTLLFTNALNLCLSKNDENSYLHFSEQKDMEMQAARDAKEKEDSTNFNLSLVARLEQIKNDDQEIRKRSMVKNMSPELKETLRKEMILVDSINLVKIDEIFKEFGYPSRELVGKDGNFTPALVIHHSKDLASRYKYLPLLEKAVEDGILNEGTLNMIKKRIKDIELSQK